VWPLFFRANQVHPIENGIFSCFPTRHFQWLWNHPIERRIAEIPDRRHYTQNVGQNPAETAYAEKAETLAEAHEKSKQLKKDIGKTWDKIYCKESKPRIIWEWKQIIWKNMRLIWKRELELKENIKESKSLRDTQVVKVPVERVGPVISEVAKLSGKTVDRVPSASTVNIIVNSKLVVAQ